MEKETTRKPWKRPEIMELEIKMTQLGGGLGFDLIEQETDTGS